MLLDARGRLMKTARIAQGGVAECGVNPRDVLREAVRCAAHSVIFTHGHPSGDPTASPQDRELTDRLRAASE